jgi:endonuclease/exonuclease/phosphatase family metal-dependent hydrolase
LERQWPGGRLSDQVDALANREPDVVALQEVTRTTVTAFTSELRSRGLGSVVDSFDPSAAASQYSGPRRYGLIVASRWPVGRVKLHGSLPRWPERFLSTTVETPSGDIEVHSTHIPPGVSNGWIKIEMLESVFSRLACVSSVPRILCGDFNTPQEETAAGEIVTWAQGRRSNGKLYLKRARGERWDRGERNILEGLRAFDLADLYRSLHGYTQTDFSWYARRRTRTIARCFDHVFASRLLKATGCRYLEEFRKRDLSDHSPIEVEFDTASLDAR